MHNRVKVVMACRQVRIGYLSYARYMPDCEGKQREKPNFIRTYWAARRGSSMRIRNREDKPRPKNQTRSAQNGGKRDPEKVHVLVKKKQRKKPGEICEARGKEGKSGISSNESNEKTRPDLWKMGKIGIPGAGYVTVRTKAASLHQRHQDARSIPRFPWASSPPTRPCPSSPPARSWGAFASST